MNTPRSTIFRDLSILLHLRLRLAFRRPKKESSRIRTHLPSKSIIVSGMVLIALCVIAISFASELSFIIATPAGRSAAASALVGIAPAIFVLLFIAALPVALVLLADRVDLTLLLLAPISPRLVLAERILSACLGTMSMILVIGIPLLLALGQAARLGPAFDLLALLVLLLLPIAPVSLVILLTVGMLHWIPPVRARTLTTILSVLFGMVGYAFSVISRQRWFTQGLEGLTAPPPDAWWATLPLSWPGRALAAAILGDYPAAIGYFAAYLAFSALILALAVVVAAHLCTSGWATYQEIGRRPARSEEAAIGERSAQHQPLTGRRRVGPQRSRPRWQALIAKEWLLLRRDPQVWARPLYALAGLAFALYGIASGTRGEVGPFSSVGPAFALVGALAFASNILISSLAAPIINREGAAFALLRLAPLSAREIVGAKWGFCALAILAIQAVLLIVGGTVTRAPLGLLVPAALALGGLTIALTGGVITLNLRWPRLDSDNPAKAVSQSAQLIGTLGGFAFTAVILGFLFFGISLLGERPALGALLLVALLVTEGIAIVAAARVAPSLLQSLLDGRRLAG